MHIVTIKTIFLGYLTHLSLDLYLNKITNMKNKKVECNTQSMLS